MGAFGLVARAPARLPCPRVKSPGKMANLLQEGAWPRGPVQYLRELLLFMALTRVSKIKHIKVCYYFCLEVGIICL